MNLARTVQVSTYGTFDSIAKSMVALLFLLTLSCKGCGLGDAIRWCAGARWRPGQSAWQECLAGFKTVAELVIGLAGHRKRYLIGDVFKPPASVANLMVKEMTPGKKVVIVQEQL